MKKAVYFIGNAVYRMVFGAIGIMAANAVFQFFGSRIIVGINPETMLVIGTLGAPGFLLLYAVSCFCFP